MLSKAVTAHTNIYIILFLQILTLEENIHAHTVIYFLVKPAVLNV